MKLRIKELKISDENENCESFDKNLLDRSEKAQVNTENKAKDEMNNDIIVEMNQINKEEK